MIEAPVQPRAMPTSGLAVRIVPVKRFSLADNTGFTPCVSGCRTPTGVRLGASHFIHVLDHEPTVGLCAGCAREAKASLDGIWEEIAP